MLAAAAALLRPAPSAVITAPARRVGLDGDAEHLVALVCPGAAMRALRTGGVVTAGRAARELDAVPVEKISRTRTHASPLMPPVPPASTGTASTRSAALRCRDR